MPNTLVFTLGLTGQVVTETLWALHHARPPWWPDAVHIVTTGEGARALERRLLPPGGAEGELARLCGALKREVPPVEVHVAERNGARLDDILSEADATAFADLICGLVGAHAGRADGSLHVSLAGGRKTMTFHAGVAASLFSGPRDVVSHVLVSPPFETHPEFWHPAQGGRLRPRGAPDDAPPTLDPKDAEITLVPVPVPLLEVYPSKTYRGRAPFAKIVADVTAARAARRAVLEPSALTVTYGGKRAKLTPKHFAVLRLLAEARRDAWPGVGPDGVGEAYAGWLTFETAARPTLDSRIVPLARFAELYHEAIQRDRNDPTLPADETEAGAIAKRLRELTAREHLEALEPGVDAKRRRLREKALAKAFGQAARDALDSDRWKLEQALREALGDALAWPILPLLVPRGGGVPSRFGLTIAPDDVEIVEGSDQP